MLGKIIILMFLQVMEHLDLHLEDISLVVDLVETKEVDLQFLLPLLVEAAQLVVDMVAVLLAKMVEVVVEAAALTVLVQTLLKLVDLVDLVL